MSEELDTTRPGGSTVLARTQRGSLPSWRKVVDWLAFPTSLVLLLLVWHFAVKILDIQAYIVPTPWDVAKSAWAGIVIDPTSSQSLLYQTGVTLRGALLGFAIGSLAGITVAIVISESRLLEKVIMPYAIGVQSVPKIAIAPLVVIWFGSGFRSLVVLTILVTLFPLLMNTYHGLHATDRDQIRLMRSMHASRLRTLMWVRLPGAAPMIFAGLDVGIIYGLIGAIVAEFVSGTQGIGVTILQYQYVNNTAGVFAALFVLGVAGIMLHLIITWARGAVVFWDKQDRRRTARRTAVTPARTRTESNREQFSWH